MNESKLSHTKLSDFIAMATFVNEKFQYSLHLLSVLEIFSAAAAAWNSNYNCLRCSIGDTVHDSYLSMEPQLKYDTAQRSGVR